ncbi:MAG: phosphatidylglycerol lysyltransferase domain-containing protein, partial [Myxococcaceae bacterium]
FEDLIRDPKAPNGTAELLVDAAMRAVAEKDSSYVTLGLVPLAGPVEGWLRVARRGARPLYDFKGLHRFKAKFRPQGWDPLFLSFPPHSSGSVALYDALNAFARGGFVRFGLETLSRGPTLAIQLLAVLLIPWIAILATASSTRWFPSPAIKWAWVGFDILVAGGLFALSQRWRHWLATLLATAITADALLTITEAITFNASRARNGIDWIVIVVAALAPTTAAAILWSGRAHRTRHAR